MESSEPPFIRGEAGGSERRLLPLYCPKADLRHLVRGLSTQALGPVSVGLGRVVPGHGGFVDNMLRLARKQDRRRHPVALITLRRREDSNLRESFTPLTA